MKNLLIKYSIYIIFILFISSCQNSNKTTRSLYIWNAELSINQTDIDFFEQNKIEKLYIRFFDIEWKNKPNPISELHFSGQIPAEIQIISVIYIKNEVIKNIEVENLSDLADNINYKINEIFSENFTKHQISEIQIDCDWTETSKDKYFQLLELLKTSTKKQISVTIRLHQIKYQQSAGIPPADKGVLMYYNMGDVTNPNEPNSIINNNIGKQYVNSNSSYPLKLSLALPVYSWSLWYNWSKNVNVLYSINVNTINKLEFLEYQQGNTYKITQDTIIDQRYLREGDIIRLEYATLNDLIEAKQICSPILSKKHEIILYSYKTKTSNLLNYENLEKIYNSN